MKLELDGLTKEFGDFTAVNHINLTMTNGVCIKHIFCKESSNMWQLLTDGFVSERAISLIIGCREIVWRVVVCTKPVSIKSLISFKSW